MYVYVEDDFDLVGGRQEKYTFYDFSNIQPINVDSDTITINDKNYNIDDVLYKKYYKDLDPSFKRLRIYSDRHTFENRNYYGAAKPEQYLTSLYGETYMIPPSEKEKEAGKHPAAYMDLKLPYRYYNKEG